MIMISLTHLQTYYGPSPAAPEPAILVRMAMDAAEGESAARKFARIQRSFPRWPMEAIGDDRLDAQGIGQRLVSLAHWLLNERRGYIRVAGCLTDNTGTTLVLGYHKPSVSMLALRLCASIFDHIEQVNPAKLNERVAEFAELCGQEHPDFQAKTLMQAAHLQNLPFLPLLPGSKLWQYGWGSRARIFMESLSDADSEIAATIARNKALSIVGFESLGMPVARSVLVSSADELPEAVRRVSFPCVAKPLDRGGGKGVTTNIGNDTRLAEAFATARSYSEGPILIEQFIQGDDHRLLVVDGQYAGAFRREPSSVTGDGVSNIRQLIKAINAARSSSLERGRYLRQVRFDAVLQSHLATLGLTLDSVLPAGRRITLRGNANLSTGGVATDVSTAIHPMLRDMVEHLSRTLRLDVAGFDYITTDPSLAPWESGGVFIEMNTMPGLDVLLAAGWSPGQVGRLILGKNVGRIPVHLHLVPRSRMGDALAGTDHGDTLSQATVAGSEIRLGATRLRVGDATPWGAVHAALRNRCVDSLRIISSAEDLIERGLPVDRFARLTLTDVSLPAPWMALLRRCCDRIDGHADTDASAAASH